MTLPPHPAALIGDGKNSFTFTTYTGPGLIRIPYEWYSTSTAVVVRSHSSPSCPTTEDAPISESLLSLEGGSTGKFDSGGAPPPAVDSSVSQPLRISSSESTSGQRPRALIYARCSTTQQDWTRQVTELRQDAERSGWEVVDILGSYVSGGANDADLELIRLRASRREFSVVMVWELSRLTRKGPAEVCGLLNELERTSVHVFSHLEPWLNVDGPARDLLVAVFGWVARWEREQISARTKSGMAARKRSGRPVGRPTTLTATKVEMVARLGHAKVPWTQIAIKTGLKKGMARRTFYDLKSGWLRVENSPYGGKIVVRVSRPPKIVADAHELEGSPSPPPPEGP